MIGVVVKKGDLVQHWHDDGRGGGFCYGLVTAAGSKRFHVTWESKIRQRRPQGDHLVKAVPEDRVELAMTELRRAGVIS